MSDLAERLRKLEGQSGLYKGAAEVWLEVCAVVEAADRNVGVNEALAALARRLDEEGL